MTQSLPLILQVKVTPNAKKNQILGWEGDILKIKVAKPPEKGEANRAAIALLAESLHLPQRKIVLIKGSTSRLKHFLLEDLSTQELNFLIPKPS